MKTTFFKEPDPEGRRDLVQRLRQMEMIEGLWEFDLASLQLYADSVAEDRQRMTQQLNGLPSA